MIAFPIPFAALFSSFFPRHKLKLAAAPSPINKANAVAITVNGNTILVAAFPK